MANILPSRPRSAGGTRRNFAVVASQYHPKYVDGLLQHFRQELELIAPGSTYQTYSVPGAWEVPVAVQEVISRGGVEAVVAFGVIVEGETAHAQLVGQTVTDALMRLGLQGRIPVVHEVLLLRSEEQARVRCLGEEINRGTEAARVAVRVAQALGEIRR